MISERLIKELDYREACSSPIKVAIAGTGFIGRGLINQISLMKGIRVVTVCNRNPEKASNVLTQANLPFKNRLCITQEELNNTLNNGEIGIVTDPLLLAGTDVDVICDCTGDINTGAALGLAAIENGKHFITNAEVDATVGPVLNKLSTEKGLVYSGVDGDEPGVIVKLQRYVSLLGLEIIAAGKFKKYYNRLATPSSVKPWADKYGHNPYLISSFTDGTKLSFEMTQVSNATRLIPEIRGMHCPRANLNTITDVLCLKDQGGILHSKGIVEVVFDVEPSGGVFVVATTNHPQIVKDFQYVKMGDGPNYLFYRPYHLCAIEMPIAIINAVLSGEATIASKGKPTAEVLAVAKCNLQPGDVLDGIGGYTYYGLIDKAKIVKDQNLLPAGMAQGARVIKPINIDEPISRDVVEVDQESVLWRLRNMQERIWA